MSVTVIDSSEVYFLIALSDKILFYLCRKN